MQRGDINRRLAKVLHWSCTRPWKSERTAAVAVIVLSFETTPTMIQWRDPESSVRDFVKYVLPAIEQKGLFDSFAMQIMQHDSTPVGTDTGFCADYSIGLRMGLKVPAHVLAECALEVLEAHHVQE